MGADFGQRRRRPAQDDYSGDGRPESEPPRKNSATVMWLVLGTGLVVSWGLVTLFGTVPIGVPDKYVEPPDTTSSGANPGAGKPKGSEASAATDPAEQPAPEAPPGDARRYALYVETRPAGARIAVAGQSVVAPARVEFDSIQPPLLVAAELDGYKPANVNVWPSEFTPKGGRLEHRLVLDLVPDPAAANPAQAIASERDPGGRPAAVRPTPAPPRVRRQPTPPAPDPVVAAAPAADPPPDGVDTPPAPEPTPEASPPPTSPQPVPAATSSGQGALAQALECLGRGDNRCVIRALENKANSARELELLIETYRAMGTTPKAETEMRRYVEIHPNGKRSAEYRRLLERRGAKF